MVSPPLQGKEGTRPAPRGAPEDSVGAGPIPPGQGQLFISRLALSHPHSGRPNEAWPGSKRLRRRAPKEGPATPAS